MFILSNGCSITWMYVSTILFLILHRAWTRWWVPHSRFEVGSRRLTTGHYGRGRIEILSDQGKAIIQSLLPWLYRVCCHGNFQFVEENVIKGMLSDFQPYRLGGLSFLKRDLNFMSQISLRFGSLHTTFLGRQIWLKHWWDIYEYIHCLWNFSCKSCHSSLLKQTFIITFRCSNKGVRDRKDLVGPCTCIQEKSCVTQFKFWVTHVQGLINDPRGLIYIWESDSTLLRILIFDFFSLVYLRHFE